MERWSNVSNEDIRSGKYVFRDIFDVYDYLHIKSGWSFGWYAAPNYRIYGEDSLQKVIHSSKYNVSYKFAKQALEERGCHLYSTSPFKYTDLELEYITNNYHKKYPGSFPDSHRE